MRVNICESLCIDYIIYIYSINPINYLYIYRCSQRCLRYRLPWSPCTAQLLGFPSVLDLWWPFYCWPSPRWSRPRWCSTPSCRSASCWASVRGPATGFGHHVFFLNGEFDGKKIMGFWENLRKSWQFMGFFGVIFDLRVNFLGMEASKEGILWYSAMIIPYPSMDKHLKINCYGYSNIIWIFANQLASDGWGVYHPDLFSSCWWCWCVWK